MNRIFTLLALWCAPFLWLSGQGHRFVDEVFENVAVIKDQVYSINATVLYFPDIRPDTLLFDVYLPVGDTCSSRPLAVILHTGTFLPRGFIGPTGDKDDYANVQVATRLAKMGYVAACIQYRKGWNPIASTDIERRSTIINAAYRSVQDLYAFIRFVNLTVEQFGNPFNVDTDRVALFGIGTGGFVAFNAAVLNQEKIYIDKFRNPITEDYFIDESVVGDLHGINPGLINFPNHVGFKDTFHFAFGLDGAVGDSSWLESGDIVPMAVAGTVTQPTTPYGIDPITGEINADLPVFAVGQFVVNITGTIAMAAKADYFGINDKLVRHPLLDPYNDPVSESARQSPYAFGYEHVWPIDLPGPQTGPWEYWDAEFWSQIPSPLDPNVSIHEIAISTNPDMSLDKANRYIDTALLFFAPRALAAMNLDQIVCSCSDVEEPISTYPDTIIVLDDFECLRNTTYGAGADILFVVEQDPANPADEFEKRGVYYDRAHDPWAALCASLEDPESLFSLDSISEFRFQLLSNTSAPVLVKLEGGTSPAYETWLSYETPGEWTNMTADFSSQAGANHTRVCIFPNGGEDTDEDQPFYLDNLVWYGARQTTVGLFDPVKVETLLVSPNPVTDMIYVRNPGDATHFNVVNILGQTVLEQKSIGQSIVLIPAGDLQSGMYIITAYNAQGKLVGNARIVK